MKQYILLFIFALGIINIKANNIEVSLRKSEKMIGTYSGKLENSASFHSIIIKNKEKNKYEFIPFYIDKSGKFIQLDRVTFTKGQRILSYHSNGDIITLLVKQDKEDIAYIVDIDIQSKKNSKQKIEDFDEASTKIIRLNNKTILFAIDDSSKNTNLSITEIEGIGKTKKSVLALEKKSEFYKTFFDNDYTVINTNEFVENGSIKSHNLYIENNIMYLTAYDAEKELINVLKTDLNNIQEYKTVKTSTNVFDKVKDVNSFINENKIYSIVSGKEDTVIQITDLETNKVQYKTSINGELSKIIDKELRQKFLSKINKKSYEPTVTANKGIANTVVVTVDYVDSRTYNYYYNWWWFQNWMWQQQIMQQQIMINNTINTGGFGPNREDVSCLLFSDEEDNSFQFVLSKDFELLPDASKETVYKNIDKSNYLNSYEDNTKIKNVSAAFTDDNYRVMYYSKKDKKVVLETNEL